MKIEGSTAILSCVECGTSVNMNTVWVDNSGPLCRNCALRRRLERVRGYNSSKNQNWLKNDWGTRVEKQKRDHKRAANQ